MKKYKTKEEKEDKNLNETKIQNGMTLIALVITIIVLLVLLGISIAMLTSDNGLMAKARSS